MRTHRPRAALHPHRTPRGHRHHRRPDRPAPARRSRRPARPPAACSCTNNLKQIGLALHNYESANGVFPPGRINTYVAGNGHCWGAYSQMLPFLEQRAVFDAMNFSMNPDPDYTTSSAVVNRTAAVMVVGTFLCPSDAGPPMVTVGGGPYSGHNYLLNVGSGYSVVQNPPAPMTSPDGILFENSAVRFADIPDGTSQTVAISETIRSSAGAPTGFSGAAVFAREPLGGFVITGNNTAGNGPPIVSDDDYASRCLTELPARLPADPRHQVALRGPRAQHVQPPPPAERQAI